jgi:glycine/D-amino acid oxidase-like deaminating enzyme
VGGGIAGVSSAYALAKKKQKVLLLEQNTLTSGSTWHAAGLVTHFKGNPAVAELGLYGREVFKEIQKEDGDIGWHMTGSIGVARSKWYIKYKLSMLQKKKKS